MADKILVVLFLSIGVFGLSQSPDIFKGQVDFDELSTKLNSISNDTVLINYWATWCKPCVEELPIIDRYSETHPNVKVVLVSLDFDTQKESKLFPYLEENNISHDVYLLVDPDANSWIPRVNENWSGAIPATQVFTGGERFFHEGVFNTTEEIINFTKKGRL